MPSDFSSFVNYHIAGAGIEPATQASLGINQIPHSFVRHFHQPPYELTCLLGVQVIQIVFFFDIVCQENHPPLLRICLFLRYQLPQELHLRTGHHLSHYQPPLALHANFHRHKEDTNLQEIRLRSLKHNQNNSPS